MIEPEVDSRAVRIAGVDITARGTLALFQRMLLDAGVSAPAPVLQLPNETVPGALIPHPGEARPFGLVVAETDESLVIIGQGLTLDFFATDELIEINSVVELLVENGAVTPGRTLNGDERLRVIPTDHVGAARIRLLRSRPAIDVTAWNVTT